MSHRQRFLLEETEQMEMKALTELTGVNDGVIDSRQSAASKSSIRCCTVCSLELKAVTQLSLL